MGLKSQTLKKSGLMTIHRGGETYTDLGGLDALKAFCRRSLLGRPARSTARPRGVLLLGVPGTGKIAFCKALGNEVGRPTLTLDIGALMGSLVGMSEERTRQALRIADAMAPCIVFIDEIEKGLSGVQASGQTDTGVSARMFGTLLSYLNDHESEVYFICSANDVSKLPAEFTRAECFDAIFFLDLPGAREKEQIWKLYLERYWLQILLSGDRVTGTSPVRRSGLVAVWLRCSTFRCRKLRPASFGGCHGRRVRGAPCETGPPAGVCPPIGPGSTPGAVTARALADATSSGRILRSTDGRRCR